MACLIRNLESRGLISDPGFPTTNVQIEVTAGSISYGSSSDQSDWDVVGVYVPRKQSLFPHLRGEIPGFDACQTPTKPYHKAGIADTDKRRQYDLTYYPITTYFRLCADANPNLLETLFSPADCIIHQTRVGDLIRENRHLFLSKRFWAKYKGYSASQLSNLNRVPVGKRSELVARHGYDTKFSAHALRLLLQAEQLIETGGLDLRQNGEFLKSVRRGEFSLEDVRRMVTEKITHLESIYGRCKLPSNPDEAAIRSLLVQCLREHYGDLGDAVVEPDATERALREIGDIVDRLRGRFASDRCTDANESVDR